MPGETQVLDRLRQRYPMLMVDRILSFEAGKELKTLKAVTVNEPSLPGHFPGFPLFPGVLTIESFAQSASILIELTEESEGTLDAGKVNALGAVLEFRFLKPILPGDRLEIHTTMSKRMGPNYMMEGKGRVGDAEVAVGKFLIGKLDQP